MTRRKVFLCVAGNIGSGKSSLTRLLSEHFHWKAFYEAVDNNPYLSDFYADMKRWAFHLQVFLLSHRFKSHKEIVEMNESVIQDRSIYEDVEIFARNLYEMGNMDRRDYESYKELFSIMVDYLKPPDILIYLEQMSIPYCAKLSCEEDPSSKVSAESISKGLMVATKLGISRYNRSR
jgi:Deoxynucleoside kinases